MTPRGVPLHRYPWRGDVDPPHSCLAVLTPVPRLDLGLDLHKISTSLSTSRPSLHPATARWEQRVLEIMQLQTVLCSRWDAAGWQLSHRI